MKKTLFILFTTIAFSLTFLSCGFQVPKEVKLKTKARYEFSVLDFDTSAENSKLKLSDYLDIGKMLEEKSGTDADSTNVKVYKYNNKGESYQQFLVHLSLPETKFDLSEAFKDLDVSNAMSAFDIDPIKFKIDPIDNTTQKQDIDVTSIREALNGLVTVVGTEHPEAEMDLEFPATFTALKYKTGTLVVEGQGGSFAKDSIVQLYVGNSKKAEGTFSGNKAEIDVSGIELTKTGMTLKFTDPAVTSIPGFQITAKEGSILWYAEGVTCDASSLTVSVDDITLPAPLPDQIKQCTVGEGSLTVDIKMPSETGSVWTDIITNYKISLSGGISDAGGTPIECTKTNKTFNLANAILADDDITASTSNFGFALTDANIYFFAKNNKNRELKPEVDVTVDVTKVSATVKLDSSYTTTIHQDQAISSDLRNYIERICWNPSGFDVTAKNTLPAGNDIKLVFTSEFLGMYGHDVNKDNEQITITAGGASAQKHTYQIRGEAQAIKLDSNNTNEDPVEYPNVDYTDTNKKIEIDGTVTFLKGYDDIEKTFEVVDIAFGEEYEISFSITPYFDWEKADVKLPSSITNGYDGNMSVGINKKTLFESVDSEIADKLSIKEIPLYVFATMPDVFDGFEFQGKMGTYYGTKQDDESITPATDPKRKNLFATDPKHPEYTDFATLGYTPLDFDSMPAIEKNANDEVKTDFGTAIIDLAPSINEASDEGSLCIEYNIKLADSGSGTNSTQITKRKLEELKAAGEASIKIDLVLILSMDFTVKSDIELDLMHIMKKDTGDLFGRSEPTSTDDIDQYIGLAKSSTITLSNIRLPFTGDVELLVDMLQDGTGKARTISNGGSYSVTLNPEELIEKYPLQPLVKVTVKPGSLTLPRELKASGKIKLGITAEGEIPIYPFSEQN